MREGRVGTWKESEPARGTHVLKSAEEGPSQDNNRMRVCQGHSLPGECKGRDNSGRRKKASESGKLTNCRSRGRDESGQRKKRANQEHSHPVERGGREGLVRTAKEREQARGTHWHGLESAEGHVRTPRKANEQGKHTFWRAQREGQVRA